MDGPHETTLGEARAGELLLRAATELGGLAQPAELLRRLAPTLAELPGWLGGGLAVLDEELDVVEVRTLGPGGEGPEQRVLPVAESDLGSLPAEGCLRLDLARGVPARLASLADRGARAYTAAPVLLSGRCLGALFAATRAALPPGALRFLEDLARVLAPTVWNGFVEARFARGDRRRDLLAELSSVVNSSLELERVLAEARAALGRLEGHRRSWVALLDEGGAGFRRWSEPAHDADPLHLPLAGSVLARLVERRTTLESDDLARHRGFAEDDELAAFGVRRYVATPLVARGRTIGGFLYGTDDPHKTRGVEVWLYENVALQLALAIDNALQHEAVKRMSARREQENVFLREEIQHEHVGGEMLGASAPMRRMREEIARVAPTDSTVLVTGATGVGKELVARALHAGSARRDAVFVRLNCAAIPEGMVESELFGHERGAFTSAVGRRLGRFELAHGGTLFLDEVGELSPAVQAKLLRVLQDGEFERLGGHATLACDVRVIAATNRDLEEAVQRGLFRSDLYYRLAVFPIRVPPLDERREDVPLLARAFLERFARRMGKPIDDLAPEALARLSARAWPGNVRELQHVIERAVILSDGPLLDLPAEEARRDVPAAPPAPESIEPLAHVEAEHLRRALAATGGVIEGPHGAARLLGLKGSTLRFRMKRHGVVRPGRESAAPEAGTRTGSRGPGRPATPRSNGGGASPADPG